jgi:murein DD-endopeptidase MepM/ murein hydrolase activator NlpD
MPIPLSLRNEIVICRTFSTLDLRERSMSCSTAGIKKNRSMRRRIPESYTILISRTGKSPTTLSFRPWMIIVGISATIAIPTISIGTIVYSYAHSNAVLTERNSSLTEEAIDIVERIETLETQINHLQQRAGVPDEDAPVEESSPQGGEASTVQAEALLEEANAQLPDLSADLRQDVMPALEQTLAREEARPQGIPLKVTTEITSEFGVRRNPFGRGGEFHNGLDFKGWYGTPIHVTAPGVVEVAESSGGYGHHVIVNHGYGYRTLYAHMSKIEVSQGTQVQKDQVLGYVGNTGRSSGPHLHYTIYRDGVAIDPKNYLN